MPAAATVLSSLPKAIVEAAASRQVDVNALLRAAKLDDRVFDTAPSRVPDVAVRRLWAHAVEQTGDPCLGLEAARFTHVTSFHGLGFGWLASPTLRDFLKRLVRYERVLVTSDWATLEEEAGRTAVRVHLPGDAEPAAGCRADAAFAMLVLWSGELTQKNFAPLAVELQHDDHAQRERYAAVFGAPITFGASANRLWFDDATLGQSLPAGNPILASEVDRITEAYLAKLGDQTTAHRVRKVLPHLLPQGEADLDTVAARLGLSARTLQRRLRAEGHTFRGLVDATRRVLADAFVCDGKRPLVEVAFRLGFADQSAFSKAFKRWTGSNPTAYAADRKVA